MSNTLIAIDLVRPKRCLALFGCGKPTRKYNPKQSQPTHSNLRNPFDSWIAADAKLIAATSQRSKGDGCNCSFIAVLASY